MELKIPNIQAEDAGDYECSARNMRSGPPVKKSFHVRVECELFLMEFYAEKNSIKLFNI